MLEHLPDPSTKGGGLRPPPQRGQAPFVEPFVDGSGKCSSITLWLCSYVALWLCGSVAMWLCGYVQGCFIYPALAGVSNFREFLTSFCTVRFARPAVSRSPKNSSVRHITPGTLATTRATPSSPSFLFHSFSRTLEPLGRDAVVNIITGFEYVQIEMISDNLQYQANIL